MPISQLRPDVNPALESVVMAALAKDPAQRWQSAEDFAEALQAAGAQLGPGAPAAQDTAAFVPVPVGDAPAAPPVLPPVVPPPRAAQPPERGRRWPWFTIGVLTVALAAFLIYLAVAGLTAAETGEVPRVVGKQLLQARAILERDGFEVEDRARAQRQAPFDQVVDQDPNPREEAEEGSTVVLEVSGGPGMVRVPTGAACRRRQAIEALDKRGLTATVDRRPSERSRRASRSARCRAPARRSSAVTRVRLFVSSGPEQVAVPDVTGPVARLRGDAAREDGFEVAVEERSPTSPRTT